MMGVASLRRARPPPFLELFSSMELLLTSDATTVILDPHGPNVINAQVHLVIPRGVRLPSASLDSIRVSLVCKESILFPGGYPEIRSWEPSVDIEGLSDVELESGTTYSWETQLTVPDDVPSYERCRSGFCYQKLTAQATFGGMRFFRKTLRAEKSVFLVPAPESDESFCYSHSQTGLAESIGPIVLQAESQHLTVGGYLRTAVHMPASSPDCTLDAVEFTLLQTMKLQSQRGRGRDRECAPKRIRLHRVLDKDCEAMQWMFRLPDDTEIRPTTVRKQNAVQITHAIEARFYYSVDDSDASSTTSTASSSALSDATLTGTGTGTARPTTARRQRKAHLLSWALQLPSCAFRWRTTHLPAYSRHDPSPVPVRGRDVWTGKNEHLSQDQCVCGQTMEEVLEVEREVWRAHGCGGGAAAAAGGVLGEGGAGRTLLSAAGHGAVWQGGVGKVPSKVPC